MKINVNYAEWFDKCSWELFVSISLGKRYTSDRLRRELNGGLFQKLDKAHGTRSASVGVLANFKERPHVHLLVLSRDRCLNPDVAMGIASSIYGPSSVDVQAVYNQSPVVRYVVNHLRSGQEENMIFFNLDLFKRSAEAGRVAA